MSDIPEDVSKLKRPELQALCKKYRIKANMKNVEMMNALSEYRSLNLMNSTTNDEPNDEHPSSSFISFKNHDDSAKEQRKSSLANIEPPTNNRQDSIITLETSPDPMESVVKSAPDPAPDPVELVPDPVESVPDPVESVPDPVESAPESTPDPVESVPDPMESVSNPVESIPDPEILQQSKRTTFTSSDDISISVQVNSTTNGQDVNSNNDDSINVDMQVETDPKGNIRVREVTVSPVKNNDDTNDIEEPFDTPPSAPPPVFSCNESSKPHNVTFTIDSPEKEVTDPLAVLSESLTYHTPNDSPLKGAWASRDENNTSWLAPSRSHGTTTCLKESSLSIVQKPSTAIENPDKENSKTTHETILELLNKRVEQRKADPNYVPPPPSKIPVPAKLKTQTAQKFDTAHRKEFNKMTSIDEVNKERNVKRKQVEDDSSDKPAKKQKIGLETSGKTPQINKSKQFSKHKTPLTSKKPKPSLLSSKKKPEKPPFRL